MKKLAILCGALVLAAGVAHAAGPLRIGLGDDPDLLDPATGGGYSGRIVFAAPCDKLIDIDAGLNFVPLCRASADGIPLSDAISGSVSQERAELRADPARDQLLRRRLRRAHMSPADGALA